MLKSVQWDVYTIIMVALVPILLLSAWGLQALDAGRLHRTQCELAVDWLENSKNSSTQFVQAGTTGRTQFWITMFEDLDSPNAAGYLRWGVLKSAEYHQEYLPDLPTDAPGVLNPRNGLFEKQIADGARHLIEHCPETEALIPDAFPMVFREGEP